MEKISLPFNGTSEHDIIRKIIDGNTDLFEVVIRRYNPVLYKICRCYGFNHQDSEDLMQEAYVAAYCNLAQFREASSFKTWLSKILIHKCIYKMQYGYFKNETPGSNAIDEHTQPLHMSAQPNVTEQQLEKKEFSRLLEKCLDEIPVMYRSVFVLREMEGFNTAETADLLKITAVNVKVRLSRAKALLQKQVEAFYNVTDIYEFNLVYCDKMVQRVFEKIKAL
jgi:RNA polymerase sigma factor (sigma-70 family)